jgi:hypothetical protein
MERNAAAGAPGVLVRAGPILLVLLLVLVLEKTE